MTIHADDVGLEKESTLKILDLVKEGAISSFSVVSNLTSPELFEEVRKVSSTTNVPIYVHFNLIEGKPITSPKDVKSLVDANGTFYKLPTFIRLALTGKIKAEDVEKELNAQYAMVRKYKIRCNGVDSHQHTHALSPVAEVVSIFGKKHGLKVRSYADIRLKSSLGICKYTFLCFIALLSFKWNMEALKKTLSWKRTKTNSIIMSWEDSSLKYKDYAYSDLHVITHPFLPYDTNKTYEAFFKTKA